MSKLETFFAKFLRELWWTITTRGFALWEIVLIMVLVGKSVPWWVGLPGFILWLFLRGLHDKAEPPAE